MSATPAEGIIKSTVAGFDITQADYGMINNIWVFSKADSGTAGGLWNTTSTHVAFTGMHLNKGVFAMAILFTATARTILVAADTVTYANATEDWLSVASSGVS